MQQNCAHNNAQRLVGYIEPWRSPPQESTASGWKCHAAAAGAHPSPLLHSCVDDRPQKVDRGGDYTQGNPPEGQAVGGPLQPLARRQQPGARCIQKAGAALCR